MKKLALLSLVVVAAGLLVTSFISSEKAIKTEDPKPASTKRVNTKWNLDKSHSFIRFSVTHMVVSEAEGNFKKFDGSFESSKADFSDAKITFTIDATTVNTENENRDKHLKSDDFFATEKYPTIKFESTAFQPLGNNNTSAQVILPFAT